VTLSARGVDERQVRVLLLDIEGTTTPIDFVYKTLFPYASRRVESFLREHGDDAEIDSLVRDLHGQYRVDEAQGLTPPTWDDASSEAQLRSSVAYVQWLIAKDSKCTPLKSLEGRIWQQGFESGELHGEVYPDVPPAFARWRKQNRKICIYSSGSVLAQQLLFRTVASGDLTSHIAAYFDTGAGVKTAAESYQKIAAACSRSTREFLFVSDSGREVEAAQSAEMQVLLCNRVASSAPAGMHTIISTFGEVLPD
jgi:enolase-phosphatase E1